MRRLAEFSVLAIQLTFSVLPPTKPQQFLQTADLESSYATNRKMAER